MLDDLHHRALGIIIKLEVKSVIGGQKTGNRSVEQDFLKKEEGQFNREKDNPASFGHSASRPNLQNDRILTQNRTQTAMYNAKLKL